MQNALPIPDHAEERRPGVQAIARAAAVLRALAAAPQGLALGELAAAVALPKSTTHRIVAALADEELVEVDAGQVRLGPAVARLGAAGRESLGARLAPLLRELRDELEETVDLSVLDGTGARFVEQAAAPHRLRAVSAIGELFPLHCTANGKALLAALPERRALDLLPRRLPRLTAATITSRERLLDELAAIRRDGIAVDREEHTEGICAVGIAVSDGSDPAAASISVPVPSQRFAGNEARIGRALRDTVDRMI
jgi:DNA-binding IclR family transcriptional regulator